MTAKALTRKCSKCGGTGREIDPVALGAKLRAERMAAGISLRELGRRMELSAMYLSDIERGHRTIDEERARHFRIVLTEYTANK